MLVVLFKALGLQSCGKEDEVKKALWTNQNCGNLLSPTTNLVGTWTVIEDDEGLIDRETVTHNADGTGVAHEDSNFAIFNGNTGETLTDFT